LIIDLNNVK